MKTSQSLQNMFAPYGYEVLIRFLESFNIFHHIDPQGMMALSSHVYLKHEDKTYRINDLTTLSFHVSKDNPYGDQCDIIVFGNTEEQVINKFERFIKLKVFL